MKNKTQPEFNNICIKTCAKVGFFLAVRQIKRASFWTTSLIVFIMVLTFLNLIVVNGILVGLIDGSSAAWTKQYSGDILLSRPSDRNYIEKSNEFIKKLENCPEIAGFTARYLEGGRVEAGYQTRVFDERVPKNDTGAIVAGIDPKGENMATELSNYIVEGEYLEPGDESGILIGANLLSQYSDFDTPLQPTLKNVRIGDRVKVRIAGFDREYIVRGIIKSKIGEVSQRVFVADSQLRKLIGRSDLNVDEIAIKLKPGISPVFFKEKLLRDGMGSYARVQTSEESQGKFFSDIRNTMSMLGNVFGSIALAVASITIFIVIFINAITRKRYIGILKAIGVNRRAVELSYVFQSIFYALIGSVLGLAVTYGFLVPFFDANPIDFPFSDGILVAKYGETFTRVLILVVTTIIAGYIPARMIVGKNTLDSILGR